MKNNEESKHAEEWVTPSIDVIDINEDTKNDWYIEHEDDGYFS